MKPTDYTPTTDDEVRYLDKVSQLLGEDDDVANALDSLARNHITPKEFLERIEYYKSIAEQRADKLIYGPSEVEWTPEGEIA